MNIVLKRAEVISIWEHLGTRKYNVMHLRRRWRSGTLLGGIAIVNGSMFGMFSFGTDYFEFKIVWENGRPVIEVLDTFKNLAVAMRLEKKLSQYIQKRIEQEQEWDILDQKFGPRYSPGEIYLRRSKRSQRSHLINLRRSAESGMTSRSFAERLASLNLVIRFKPKH